MFNFIVAGTSQCWNGPTFAVSNERMHEGTPEHLTHRLAGLSNNGFDLLKGLPTLFAYEHYLREPAVVGRVVKIVPRPTEIQISFSIDFDVMPLKPVVLDSLALGLDITNEELARTHWAVKDGDLLEALRARGLIYNFDFVTTKSPTRPPKVFLSYSWDSPEHSAWVANLAAHLRQNGIEAILDQWYASPGTDLGAFMERSIREADRVLVICTELYAKKANEGIGGVGYEHMMVRGELMRNVGSDKFLPIVRQSKSPPSLPSELRSRVYLNLSDGENYHDELSRLVKSLHSVRPRIPPLGVKPFVL